jgi:hypothetical protein
MRFEQSRKTDAMAVANQVRHCLEEHYQVHSGRVASVEDIHDGRYRTDGGMSVAHMMDFAGIDWVVDDGIETVGVAERVRPVDDRTNVTVDFSLRVDNGTHKRCESEAILQNAENGGLWPREILFGRRRDRNLEGAWLLDTETVVSGYRDESIPFQIFETGDGTKAAYFELIDLVNNDAVIDGWEDPGPVSEAIE